MVDRSKKIDISKSDITAVILSGGAGQRLGGVDKGLETFKGKALIEHVIDNISDQVNDIILCVNRNHQRYEQYGYPLVSDKIENNNTEIIKERYQGPLAGITAAITALEKSLTPHKESSTLSKESSTLHKESSTLSKEPSTLHKEPSTLSKEPLTKTKQHCILISSCDSPSLPNDYVTKLSSSMVNNNVSSVVIHDGKRPQNLHCLIHSSAWQSLQDFYNQGGRAMHQWHKKNGSIEINFSDQAACFLNINSAELLN